MATEVVSNFHLEGEERWSGELNRRLRALGWKAPRPPKRPNWLRVEATTSPSVAEVAKQTAETLAQVFGLDDEDKVFVKMFGSPIRGNTPACPENVTSPSD
jgi:hypothetical protein